ncbi:MAG: septum site-determining protein MinC [Castellaniella sp.]|uniref:septum site-determining protein MinC n=1 Tax=Castellaniella sp. TaxID=1955812 RepID=UPI0012119B97|nr:septum site-determining protein MinC [Castellaniella sp.]TAN29723.1 MAG: septum site-determining protein MinC [Castellaniella sp.]
MAKTSTALDFKSATLYALRAVLHDQDTDTLVTALDARMREAGAFYENEPVVIDAQGLTESPDWEALAAALRRHHLHPIGVHASAELQAQAAQSGLAPLDISASPAATAGSGSRTSKPAQAARKTASTEKPVAAERDGATSAAATGETLVVRHPLRSGQRIYAKGTDLIVMGMVSQGAEVIADGNIHVYGPLRGKAMAGAHGRTDAMILTTQLDPELLAIAGVYRVIETRLPDSLQNRPAQVSLDGDTLRIRTLDESDGSL